LTKASATTRVKVQSSIINAAVDSVKRRLDNTDPYSPVLSNRPANELYLTMKGAKVEFPASRINIIGDVLSHAVRSSSLQVLVLGQPKEDETVLKVVLPHPGVNDTRLDRLQAEMTAKKIFIGKIIKIAHHVPQPLAYDLAAVAAAAPGAVQREIALDLQTAAEELTASPSTAAPTYLHTSVPATSEPAAPVPSASPTDPPAELEQQATLNSVEKMADAIGATTSLTLGSMRAAVASVAPAPAPLRVLAGSQAYKIEKLQAGSYHGFSRPAKKVSHQRLH
jgi:hypothetical protein